MSVKSAFAGVVIVLVTVLLCFFSSLFILSRFMIGYPEPIRTFLTSGLVAVCLIFAISLATCRKYRIRVGSLVPLILAGMVLYYLVPTVVLIIQCYQHGGIYVKSLSSQISWGILMLTFGLVNPANYCLILVFVPLIIHKAYRRLRQQRNLAIGLMSILRRCSRRQDSSKNRGLGGELGSLNEPMGATRSRFSHLPSLSSWFSCISKFSVFSPFLVSA